jgi:hypothetical protein
MDKPADEFWRGLEFWFSRDARLIPGTPFSFSGMSPEVVSTQDAFLTYAQRQRQRHAAANTQ